MFQKREKVHPSWPWRRGESSPCTILAGRKDGRKADRYTNIERPKGRGLLFWAHRERPRTAFSHRAGSPWHRQGLAGGGLQGQGQALPRQGLQRVLRKSSQWEDRAPVTGRKIWPMETWDPYKDFGLWGRRGRWQIPQNELQWKEITQYLKKIEMTSFPFGVSTSEH